jgi:hypothetical protein
MLGKRFAVGHRSYSRTVVLAALRRSRGLAMSLHSHWIERGGNHWNPHGLRSQPVRSACFRAQKPARDIRCLASVCRSFTFGPLDRRAIMSIANTLPGELHGRIISSIINLVCPQCGGRMSEFQCEGRCCRNWLAEWEWANHVTRSSKSRVAGHRAKPMR